MEKPGKDSKSRLWVAAAERKEGESKKVEENVSWLHRSADGGSALSGEPLTITADR